MEMLSSYLDYELVSEKAKCPGDFLMDCNRVNAAECAESCRNVSSMFSYGRNGSIQCDADGKCQCTCLLDAVNGSCQQMTRENVDLYRYSSQLAIVSSKKDPTGEVPSKLLQSFDKLN